MNKNICIHNTALVSEDARIGEGVKIGPYSIIGPDVSIGADSEIGPHSVIEGRVSMGKYVRISQFASIGAPPQDLKYAGEDTQVEIADRTVIREFVTIHRGTMDGKGVTRIGGNCLLMAYTHIAHDCQVGNNVIMANAATLGGHVFVGENVVIGGLSAIHQFCHIGDFAFLGGMSGINKDIPPYVKYWGSRGKIRGLNLVGMRRLGLSRETIEGLRSAYKTIFHGQETLTEAVRRLSEQEGLLPEVRRFVEFIKESKRGVPVSSNSEEED
jgi:UDP-N-acetylglucosamine acyltransferase